MLQPSSFCFFFRQKGPKPNTLSDFWCMVLQENVDQIIMLTNLKEGRKVNGVLFSKIKKKLFSLKQSYDIECYFYLHFRINVLSIGQTLIQ